MFNLRFFSDQFGYSQRDEAVEQAEQCAHFGGVGNAAVGIGDFGDKQGNRQSDACRHADQQQIEVGDGVVDPELKQTGNFDHQVNAESLPARRETKTISVSSEMLEKTTPALLRPKKKARNRQSA